ncbi:MAG: hypothetical protein JNL05_08505 [Flavobacteriales bacterium]|nr:hypothetical protein [Flavobacteriales bacterium]
MRLRTSLIALLLGLAAIAQRPGWRTTVGPAARTGPHAVRLSPEVVGRSQGTLNDVRLLAPDSTLVPFVVRTAPAQVSEAHAVAFTMLRNDREGRRTVVEFEVPQGTLMDGFTLGIRNAEVGKSARITGSDDRRHWFMVKDDHLSLSGDEEARSLRWVDLPLSDHRYYRIELNDSLTAPVQVLSVGHTVQARSEGRYQTITTARWDRIEVKGRTLVRITADHPLVIDRLRFAVADTVPYLRHYRLYTYRQEERQERRRKVMHRWTEELGAGTIASYARPVITGPGVAVDTLFLALENGDDRPLRITRLEVLQLERALLANLQAGVTYTLTTGDPAASAPRFDLTHFQDSLPTPLDTLVLGALIPVPRAAAHKPFDLSQWWVWVAMLVVGGLAAFGALRALRREKP